MLQLFLKHYRFVKELELTSGSASPGGTIRDHFSARQQVVGGDGRDDRQRRGVLQGDTVLVSMRLLLRPLKVATIFYFDLKARHCGVIHPSLYQAWTLEGYLSVLVLRANKIPKRPS